MVIAHRLSTIRHADRIIVMEKGEIVEQGDHQTLMDAKGAYFNLVEKQTLSQVKEAEELEFEQQEQRNVTFPEEKKDIFVDQKSQKPVEVLHSSIALRQKNQEKIVEHDEDQTKTEEKSKKLKVKKRKRRSFFL